MLAPVRLACVKPAASVRSEPGSNSQVHLRSCSRLVTSAKPLSSTVFLTSSKHIRLKRYPTPARLTAFQRKPLPRRDEFLKRDRQLSLFRTLPPDPLSSRPTNPTPKPRKDPAAHVSLPSDAIVKQRWVRDDRPKPIARSLKRISTSRQPACKARLELQFPCRAARPRGRDDRKSSAPASQQGGVRSRSPETNRSGRLKGPPSRRSTRI